MSKSPLLEVRGLEVSYGAIQALNNVSLEVNEGEIVTLIGANGAGKTTTLRAISGMVKPKAGTISYQGESIRGIAPNQLVGKRLIHVPEGRGIFLNLTVEENLALGAYTRTDDYSADLKRVYELFPRVQERLKQTAGTMSGGEQQMLAIGRALLAKPKVLMLDEPSLGLAPKVVQTIFSVIREINQSGTTILLIEQNARMALQTAHRAYVLEAGNIIMQGDARQLADSDEVRKAYLGVH